MKRILLLISVLLLTLQGIKAQDECSDRYREPVFTGTKKTFSVQFGVAPMPGGANRNLMYDVYEPEGDTLALRPLVILWHGGAFLDNLLNRRSPDILAIADYLVQRGYVVISPGYRGIKSLASLISERDMVQAVVRALLDGNDAVCHIVNDIDNGNPFRIDKDQIFAGGVSAGGVIGLQGIFINSLDDLTPQQKTWALQVDGGRAQEVIDNKFCGGIPKGFINIAGCILDTAWMKYSTTALLLIHGTDDPIQPYDVGYPLSLPTLPKMMGSKPINEKALELGMDVTLKKWEGKGHVPFFNLDIADLLTLNLVDQAALDQTLIDIRDFIFSRIECEPAQIISSVRPSEIKSLNIFPNPSSGAFNMQMPEDGIWWMEIRDVTGRLMHSQQFTGSRMTYSAEDIWPAGIYLVQVASASNSNELFSGKLIIR
jgi:poly(3-hydroxybutyrate) depolymerase